MEGKATSAADVQVPETSRIVELTHLKTRDGKPVRVRCEKIDEAAEILQRLPGDTVERARARVARRKATAAGQPEPAPSEAEVRDGSRFLKEIAPRLIELGTVLDDGEGGEVRPAFWFDPATPRHPLSLPCSVLRIDEKALLTTTVIALSGFGKEDDADAGAGAGFHAGDGDGREGRVGAVAPGAGERPDAVGNHA
jgi:hypothetical protein